MQRASYLVAPVLALCLAVACSSSSDSDDTGDVTGPGGSGDDAGTADAGPTAPAPTPLPPLTNVKTTLEVTLDFAHAKQTYEAGPNAATSPAALDDYLTQNFGELVEKAGEEHTKRTMDDTAPPAAVGTPKRLVRFVHLADLQLADDESPSRVSALDGPGLLSSSARPQDEFLCRLANGAVRTINGVHDKDPFSFVLMGGDNADNAQANEVDWVLDILSGAPSVKCDSGEIDDPVPGPDNDGKDAFVAAGLKMPWRWVTGNHDVLGQGNFDVNERAAQTVGDLPVQGTRTYAKGKLRGEITENTIVADPRRAVISRAQLMSKVSGHGDGHGLTEQAKARGRATYYFDVPDAPLRFVIIDTASDGGAEGVIRKSDVDEVIKPALDDAKANGKFVILASHHAHTSLTTNGGTLGKAPPDPVEPAEFLTFVASYPNVVFSIVGHSHENRVRVVKSPSDAAARGFWEVMTSAIADFPHQFRSIEIWDDNNGYLRLRSEVVDLSFEGDTVGNEGRRRGVVDAVTGYVDNGQGVKSDRNVEIWIKK